jgi:hypothetical protein
VRSFHKVKLPLNAVKPHLYPVQPAMNTSLPFFDIGDANLEIANVVDDTIDFLVYALQVNER